MRFFCDSPFRNASFYVPPDLVNELTAFYQKVNPSKVDTVSTAMCIITTRFRV